jgi:hypothetical protein
MLRASTASYNDNFTFYVEEETTNKSSILVVFNFKFAIVSLDGT